MHEETWFLLDRKFTDATFTFYLRSCMKTCSKMEPPSTPPDRKKRRVAPETPPKDKRFSDTVLFPQFLESSNIGFLWAGQRRTGVESQLAKAERGRAGNWHGPVGAARLAGRVSARHGD